MAGESPASPSSSHDRLDSWKEIAAYLKRDVTTVQRWEKRESMPVHRHLHDKLGSVYAFRSELDAWARRRTAQPTNGGPIDLPVTPTAPDTTPAPVRATRVWLAAALVSVAVTVAVVAMLWFQRRPTFWSNSVLDLPIEAVTDFDGLEQAAAISRDGRVGAFLSDRGGRIDVWVTRLGSGQFRNLTAGSALELINPSVRTLGFTPDGESVTYWVRRSGDAEKPDIGIWSVPIIGGASSPYLHGAAELDWTRDGSRLVYHTTAPGDPMFVTTDPRRLPGTRIFAAPAGLHAHYPVWSTDGGFIYFVQGVLPDKMDIWRMTATGSGVERLTNHDGRVSHPAVIDSRTLLYLASDADGNGPWLYSLDVRTRVSRRLLAGADRYTSLAVDATGHRLLLTAAHQKRTLWRLSLHDGADGGNGPSQIDLPNGTGFFPRLGPDYLAYVSSVGGREHLWKLTGSVPTELWSGADARVIGAPAISPDGSRIALSVRYDRRRVLYVMRDDGSDLRALTDALALSGSPAWTPDGRFITSATEDSGTPKLVNVPLDGSAPVPLVQEYSTDPSWSPDGRIVVYSGADIGTTFPIKSASLDRSATISPLLTLTRGARHLAFLRDTRALVVLRGAIDHKDLWLVDLETRLERALTNVGSDFAMTDFDISPDGREAVLERSQERSNIILFNLQGRP
jgi:Tol biopolymer transport system component